MKSPYVSELQPNQVVTAMFLVQHKDIRQKKTGEPYLVLTLGDRTGDIEARMWDNVGDVIDTFERDDFLKVRGLLQIFQNRLQLTVHKLQKQADQAVDFTDFFPTSKRDPEEMFAELRALIASMTNQHLRALLTNIFDDAEIARRFKIAPAAKTVHHAYLSGLIDHVLSMCAIARMTAAHYADIDVDLLLAGVLLHDIGKIYELTYDRSFGYSTQGQLLGHITIGMRMVEEKARGIDGFPPKLRMLLDHMILSHHGELEFGSPKTPLFPEALLLHHIDNMDSKMECMRASLEKDRQVDGCWSSYIPSLERAVLKKLRYMEEQETTVGASDAAAPVEPAPQPQVAAVLRDGSRFHPASSPAPVQRPSSPFAEKLMGALQPKEQ